MNIPRIPLVNANWKMAMTVSESLTYLQDFLPLVEDALERVQVTICPPATALYSLHMALETLRKPSWRISLGAQNMSESADFARTGQLSAALLAEAGCKWVMLGHWEVRRHLGDDDARVSLKVHRALDAGLHSLLLVGPKSGESLPIEDSLSNHLSRILQGCNAQHVEQMAFVFEPEDSIGQDLPADPHVVSEGCRFIRVCLGRTFGDRLAETVRIIYGGSVTPEYAAGLLASPHVDGLGASRQGRDPVSFAKIVRLLDQAKNSS